MRLPGLKTLVRTGRWLRSRFTPHGLILGYHRVAEAGACAPGMSVSPAHLAEQLDVVRRHCRPVSLNELVHGLAEENLPPQAVAVTFDDGYAEVLQRAKPLLESYGIPATAFVVTGRLGRAFAWDDPAQADARSLAADEIRQLANGLVEIGAHTVNHLRLAAQPMTVQRSEIQESKRVLEALLGRPVIAFSYPHGSASPETRALVQAAGFHYACASQPDVARRGSHHYHLPRLWVPDVDGHRFARWLQPWLQGNGH